MAEREALFYFGGGGLFVAGEVLGRTAEFEWCGRRTTIGLPGEEQISDASRWGKEARKTSWREDNGAVV